MHHVRYVVLRHEGVAVPHFDLMFESEPSGDLHTWRSLQWPIKQDTRLTRLVAHRPIYLEFEGPLANNYGHVKRVESGTCEINWPNHCECTVQLDRDGTALQLKQIDDRNWLATPTATGA